MFRSGSLYHSHGWRSRASAHNLFRVLVILTTVCLLQSATGARADDGAAGWLRYAPLTGPAKSMCRQLPSAIVVLDADKSEEQRLITSAAKELKQGIAGFVLHLEDDAGGDSAGLDVGDGLVDLLERSGLADHAGLAGGVELEHLAQVLRGADDRADDRDAVEDGLEDRES